MNLLITIRQRNGSTYAHCDSKVEDIMLLLLFSLSVVGSFAIDLQHLSKEQIEELRVCKDAFTSTDFSTIDAIGKNCFSKCVLEHRGYLTPTGDFNEDKVKALGNPRLNRCLLLKDDDVCRKSSMFAVCEAIATSPKNIIPCKKSDEELHVRTFEDLKKSCHSLCPLQTFGVITKDGEFNKTIVEHPKIAEYLREPVLKCMEVSETDICRKATAFAGCLWLSKIYNHLSTV